MHNKRLCCWLLSTYQDAAPRNNNTVGIIDGMYQKQSSESWRLAGSLFVAQEHAKHFFLVILFLRLPRLSARRRRLSSCVSSDRLDAHAIGNLCPWLSNSSSSLSSSPKAASAARSNRLSPSAALAFSPPRACFIRRCIITSAVEMHPSMSRHRLFLLPHQRPRQPKKHPARSEELADHNSAAHVPRQPGRRDHRP